MASSPTDARVLLLATLDTKLEESAYVLRELLRSSELQVTILDIGRNALSTHDAELLQFQHRVQLLSFELDTPAADVSRGDYSSRMASSATQRVAGLMKSPTTAVHGILGIGGSTGSSMVAAVMRDAVAIGLPKLLVSTMASGDVGHLVGGVDITLMYSVVDIAGLNFLSEKILGNAAAAMAGMARQYREASEPKPAKSHLEARTDGGKKRRERIAITMFGVTTPGVDRIRHMLSQPPHGAEVVVFHATGSGGRAMETLIRQGEFDAVIDLTTSEIADEVGGGILSAGPDRLSAGAQAQIPYIVSVGACDMINFGPMSSVKPELIEADKKGERKLYQHNPSVTLLRTDLEENRRIGEFIGEKLTRYERKDLVKVLFPEKSISMISGDGGPFEDRNADRALFETLTGKLEGTGIQTERHKLDINEPGFANEVVDALVEMKRRKGH
ncbi:uncharacterized protein PG998_001605 [Apiospora kogelbergensis]|uniref:uncharacterized protein n=1 Tax=Apiospora kogelbergensis TaxID=1337665 RepID=UPI00313051E2